ncbi:peptidoglycan-binding protein [Propioniciclava tarda]|uniref:Peptidoglycan binding-like domain-containing protein n=1 Tax=Propioniciclava tarda TaxID=433330 RepID=A0A4Q9KHJ0_PROTD|nr:hypothetical protein ET996_13965 [Propioniciclava tarda]SMO87345.1 Putative peptidoglycan binding domain-containing protein [Propioniciclava tarda]
MSRYTTGSVSAVKTLQSTLNKCYGKSLSVDGVFGSATASALASAQSSEGITADGMYGSSSAYYLKFNVAWAANDGSSMGWSCMRVP